MQLPYQGGDDIIFWLKADDVVRIITGWDI